MAQRHLYERRRLRRVRRTHRRVPSRPMRLASRTALTLLILGLGVGAALRTHAFGLRLPGPGLRPVRQAIIPLPPSAADRHARTSVSLPHTFSPLPNGEFSRAALAILLAARQHLALTSIGPRFEDVSSRSPAFASVEAAAGAGDFGQAPARRFHPTEPVTRAFLATALVNALGLGQEATLLNHDPVPAVHLGPVPVTDRGAFTLAYALGLMEPVHGEAAPGVPASLAEVSAALAAWPSLPSPALATPLGRQVSSITLRVSQSTVWPGEPVSVSTQVHVGELTVPLAPVLTASGGTLDGNIFLPGPGSHTAAITATVPGSSVRVIQFVHVVTVTSIRILGPQPTYVLPGSPVTFHIGVVGPSNRPIPLDNGRRLHLSVVGATGVLAQATLHDEAGLANFTFTPTLLGHDQILVTAPGLKGADLVFTVVPGSLGTVSLLTRYDSLTVGQGLSLHALWTSLGSDPKLKRSIPLQLTASLQASGRHTSQTLDSWAVSLPPNAATASVPLPSVPPITEPGTLTVSLGAPGNAVEPSVITLPVTASGSLRILPPRGALVGRPVHLLVKLTGHAPAGSRPELALTAPDGGPLSPIGGATAGDHLEFEFIPREAGTYVARISLPGDGSVEGTVSVSPGPAVRLEALLPSPFLSPGEPLTLTPYAVDRNGQPVLGPVIEFRWRVLGSPSRTKAHGPRSAFGGDQTSRARSARSTKDRSKTTGPFTWHTLTLASGQPATIGTLPARLFSATAPHEVEVELRAAGLPSVRARVPWIPVLDRRALAEGTGVFLSYWVARDESAQSLVKKALADHVHTLFVEASVPGTGFWGQPGLDRLLPVAHRAGLSVLAWVPANLRHPALDIAVARAVLSYRTPLGQRVDGIAADFEGNLSPSILATYLSAVRKAAGPDRVIAAIEAAPPADAEVDPILGRAADVLMPMDYWQMTEAPSTYQTAYEQVGTSVQFLRLDTPAAVVPILQGYDPFSPGGAGLYNPGPLAERGALRAAFASGGAGAAFFQWGSLTPAEWQVVNHANRHPPRG